MVDFSKRFFFKKYLMRQLGEIAREFDDGLEAARDCQAFNDFFDSYESSYALTLAYPDEILLETARQCGIETKGREKKKIIKELFEKHGGYTDRFRKSFSE